MSFEQPLNARPKDIKLRGISWDISPPGIRGSDIRNDGVRAWTSGRARADMDGFMDDDPSDVSML